MDETTTECEICTCKFMCQKELNAHKDSYLHHIALEEKYGSDKFHNCLICRKKIGKLSHFKQHLNGHKHQIALKKRSYENINPNMTDKSEKKMKTNGEKKKLRIVKNNINIQKRKPFVKTKKTIDKQQTKEFVRSLLDSFDENQPCLTVQPNSQDNNDSSPLKKKSSLSTDIPTDEIKEILSDKKSKSRDKVPYNVSEKETQPITSDYLTIDTNKSTFNEPKSFSNKSESKENKHIHSNIVSINDVHESNQLNNSKNISSIQNVTISKVEDKVSVASSSTSKINSFVNKQEQNSTELNKSNFGKKANNYHSDKNVHDPKQDAKKDENISNSYNSLNKQNVLKYNENHSTNFSSDSNFYEQQNSNHSSYNIRFCQNYQRSEYFYSSRNQSFMYDKSDVYYQNEFWNQPPNQNNFYNCRSQFDNSDQFYYRYNQNRPSRFDVPYSGFNQRNSYLPQTSYSGFNQRNPYPYKSNQKNNHHHETSISKAKDSSQDNGISNYDNNNLDKNVKEKHFATITESSKKEIDNNKQKEITIQPKTNETYSELNKTKSLSSETNKTTAKNSGKDTNLSSKSDNTSFSTSDKNIEKCHNSSKVKSKKQKNIKKCHNSNKVKSKKQRNNELLENSIKPIKALKKLPEVQNNSNKKVKKDKNSCELVKKINKKIFNKKNNSPSSNHPDIQITKENNLLKRNNTSDNDTCSTLNLSDNIADPSKKCDIKHFPVNKQTFSARLHSMTKYGKKLSENQIRRMFSLSSDSEEDPEKKKDRYIKRQELLRTSSKNEIKEISIYNTQLKNWSEKIKIKHKDLSSSQIDIINQLVNNPFCESTIVKLKYFVQESLKSNRSMLEINTCNMAFSNAEKHIEKIVINVIDLLSGEMLKTLVKALETGVEWQQSNTKDISGNLNNLTSDINKTKDDPKSINHSNCTINSIVNSLLKPKSHCVSQHNSSNSLEISKDKLTETFVSTTIQNTKFVKSNDHITASNQDISLRIKEEPVEIMNISNPFVENLNEEIANITTSNELTKEIIPNLDANNLVKLLENGLIQAKVKTEFDDPAIEALQSNPSLISQATNSSTEINANIIQTNSSILSPKKKKNNTNIKNCVNNDPSSPLLKHQNEPKEKCSNSSIAIDSANEPKENLSFKDSNNTTEEKHNKLLQAMTSQLLEITSQEETLRTELDQAEMKIAYFQEHLDHWKNIKMQLKLKENAFHDKRMNILQKLQEFSGDYSESSLPRLNLSDNHPKRKLSDETKTTSSIVIPEDAPLQNDLNTKIQDEISIIEVAPKQIPVINLELSPEKPRKKTRWDKSNDVNIQSQASTFSNQEDIEVNISNLKVHESIIRKIQVFDNHLYICSNMLIKRINLTDPSSEISYSGHTKNITAFCVSNVDQNAYLFSSSYDNHLHIINIKTSKLVIQKKMECTVLCLCIDWNKLFLGLNNGKLNICNPKDGKVLNILSCSSSSISCMTTTTQGTLHLICVLSYDGIITIWDSIMCLLLRGFERRVQLPCCLQILDNFLYVTTSEKKLLVQDITSGKVKQTLNFPFSATGLVICNDYLIATSYDGHVRCYDTKNNLKLHSVYYGAGKETVMSITSYLNWIFTGNRKGIVDAFKFDPTALEPCEFKECFLQFGRKEDLRFHVKTEHCNNNTLTKAKKCPWRSCLFVFPSTWSSESKKGHIEFHTTRIKKP